MPQCQSHSPFFGFRRARPSGSTLPETETLVLNLHNRGAAHTAADAQGRKTGLRALRPHLVKQGYQDTASGSTYGMSQRDGAAVGIQLSVHINTQVLAHRNGLRRKCHFLLS